MLKINQLILLGLTCVLFISCGSNDDDTDNGTDDKEVIELPTPDKPYSIVDTGVSDYYSDDALISKPSNGTSFFGQDASYSGNQPSYTNNEDGTITDNVTGLQWEQDMGEKITFTEAFTKASNSSLGGHSDWRVPTLKELYSLILFT